MGAKPRPITVAWLKRHHACPEGIERFRELFGESAALTKKNIELCELCDTRWIIKTAKLSIVHTYPNGTKYYYQHGKVHRDGGPAIEYPDGTTFYYQHGKLVRR